MTKNLDDIGLKSVADHYDLFFVDLWGVVHNGIELYKDSTNARKLLKKNYDKKSEALELIMESKLIYEKEIFWRLKAKDILLEDFILLSKLGEETFGLRKQDSLNKEQAVYLARCKSSHEDISLYF